MIESLFPSSVATQVATAPMWQECLLPPEEVFVERALARRRREFTAGRACARAALAKLGVERGPLLSAPDRTPAWPDGVVGSISHCADLCAAAVARKLEFAGIGLDVERADPLESSLIGTVCAEEELEDAIRVTGLQAEVAAKILFSAKETVYKCSYPLTRTWWDFRDVTVRLSGPGAWTGILPAAEWGSFAPPRSLEGRFVIRGSWILTGCSLSWSAL